MNKPNRKVRKFFKRKGKGKGKTAGAFLQTMPDSEVEATFFDQGHKGRGKSKGKRSSGKGKGRKQNPKGPDGQIMKCRVCGSIEHFQRECPNNNGSIPPPTPHTTFMSFTTSATGSVTAGTGSVTTGQTQDANNQPEPLNQSLFSVGSSRANRKGNSSIFMMNFDDGRSVTSRSETSQSATYTQAQSSQGDPWYRNDPWLGGGGRLIPYMDLFLLGAQVILWPVW